MLIYKILRESEWATLEEAGETAGSPDDLADGFIHFSTAEQLPTTAAKHFGHETLLWLLAVESDRLDLALKWELSRSGQLFPHLYGNLRRSDVIWAKPLPNVAAGHLFPEEIAGHIDPTRAQFDTFKALQRDHPIDMLNLVRLRTRARYPDDHEFAGRTVSGDEAYSSYGRETAPILQRLGASIVWRGSFQSILIGSEGERWDRVFIARYPTAHAFLAMVTDQEYRRAVVHRQAAVRTSRLIRCAPAESGAKFG